MSKVIIITGASRGIGRETAKLLARNGHTVIANYNKSAEKAKELQEELKKENINIDIYKADVSKREECKALVEYAIEKYKHIDVLVNNAGISLWGQFTDLTDAEIEEIFSNSNVTRSIKTHDTRKTRMHNKYVFNMGNGRGIM
jgi:3-oxoacyl-[acyl-carrier protein] reductase